MKRLFTSMAISLVILTISSCGGPETDPPTPKPSLSVTPDKVEIAGTGGVVTLDVKATELWLVDSDQTWCSVNKSQGIGDETITITINTANPDSKEARKATITLKTTNEIVTVGVTQLAGPDIPLTDNEKLMKLFEATGGKNWAQNSGWGTKAPVSEWYGVVVDEVEFEKIIGLNLEENNLTGTLPKEIFDLTSLQFFNIQKNKIKGEIPSNMGNLINAVTLSFYENALTGSIPTSIGNMKMLSYFSVWLNKMSGPIPMEIGNCTELADFWLYGNQFSGAIPTSLGNLKKLERLFIRENDFSGTIPKELGNCERLISCELGINPKLEGTIPAELGNLKDLEYLYLRSCNLTGEIPSALFAKGSKLNKLNIRSNNLTGSIPESISNATLLEEAFLYENKLQGTVPEWLLNKVKANKDKFILTPQQSGFTFTNLAN